MKPKRRIAITILDFSREGEVNDIPYTNPFQTPFHHIIYIFFDAEFLGNKCFEENLFIILCFFFNVEELLLGHLFRMIMIVGCYDFCYGHLSRRCWWSLLWFLVWMMAVKRLRAIHYLAKPISDWLALNIWTCHEVLCQGIYSRHELHLCRRRPAEPVGRLSGCVATVFANVRSYASYHIQGLRHFCCVAALALADMHSWSFSVLISTGLNFRLEMPLADAQAFLVDKARHVSQFHVLTVYF